MTTMQREVAATVCNVALVGFGTVGQSVAKILSGHPVDPLRLTHICNRDIQRKKVDWLPSTVEWTERIDDIFAADVDVVVELIGGLAPAGDWVRGALLAGKAVVTANKQLIAHAGHELLALARQQGRRLRFEAAVGGGIPVIRGIEEGLAGDRLVRIQGVLNGTCNYILTRMEHEGLSFEAALREAQQQGYAEADPAEDVDGLDARAKLAILTSIGLHCSVAPADIPCHSIATVASIDIAYANRLGCAIRQVSWVQRELADEALVCAGVQPALVPRTASLARVEGPQNIIVVEGERGGETTFSGYGAGGGPTAVAVVSDLLAIARSTPRGSSGTGAPLARWARVAREFVAPHYVRFTVQDRPGIIAAIAEVFGRHDINIDAVLQERGHSKLRLPFVMTLEPCGARSLQRALEQIEAMDFHVERPVSLPILAREERRWRV